MPLQLQIWTYDQQNNKLRPENVKLGNLQRQFRSLEVDEHDRFAYAGSTSGDVLQVRCLTQSQATAATTCGMQCAAQDMKIGPWLSYSCNQTSGLIQHGPCHSGLADWVVPFLLGAASPVALHCCLAELPPGVSSCTAGQLGAWPAVQHWSCKAPPAAVGHSSSALPSRHHLARQR